ncbi:glucosamine--fructose-6-phosphate aminotransferase (isomerizing) [Babesia microti strain RI]|uniref:glutamine--fructose-6-phosphate transaminase (isomerizing) n=1 Tax=Babesia microti (strain RI) TaxID=1133968 RepID=I7ISJ5_BABMR|nr:glucosamine--fructose-6-phosphate aminotransferase (isomerizing) [Babesia microti strain RI]CCF75671.1 glucosamine--fructose-6-phosphate aminotransferase (isomerizing) [Babesia microti strain RI]|eukprot:XP_012650079.1 glucosamine--fructose-6-phosphate aminotransferase (isomerizing) [Babesia microti strain RI]
MDENRKGGVLNYIRCLSTNLYSTVSPWIRLRSLIPRTECCGIVGASGFDDVQVYLYQGIEYLQHRGYDSCGIATRKDDGSLVITKCSGNSSVPNKQSNPIECLSRLKDLASNNHLKSRTGIGHTRWATVGGLNDKNAHPHSDYKNRIALAHNGTIYNSHWLFEHLKCSPLFPKIKLPESDSEAVAHLIGMEMDSGLELEDAINSTIKKLDGTWAFVIASTALPYLIVSRKESPLLIGKRNDDNGVIVASEVIAFGSGVDKYVPLSDNTTMKLDDATMDKLFSTGPVYQINNPKFETSPSPYKYWIEKEIYEQPKRLQDLFNNQNFNSILQSISNEPGIGKFDFIFAGCGSSLHSAHFIAYIMKLLIHKSAKNTFKVYVVDTSEMTKESAMEFYGSPKFIIYLSQSGETLDTIHSFNLLKTISPKSITISIVNDCNSYLAQITNYPLCLNAGREMSVASTKTFTSQSFAGLKLIQSIVSQLSMPDSQKITSALESSLSLLPTSITSVCNQVEKIQKLAKQITTICETCNSLFILGRGAYFVIAKEGALKLKEVPYLHAEAVQSGLMKHGTLAMINSKDKTPTISLIFEEDYSVPICAAEQLKARGSYVVCVTDKKELVEDFADEFIVIKDIGYATPLSAVVVFQLLAYFCAMERGIDPDYPRGLAKTVTVL